MKPALLLGAGLVAVAVIAAVVVIGGGGQSTDGAPQGTADAAPATPARVEPPAPAATPLATANAEASLEAWAAPLRAAGLAVTAEGLAQEGSAVLIAGLAIGDPSGTRRWLWRTGSAALIDADTDNAVLTPRGDQTLALTDDNGVVTTLVISAASLSIGIEHDAAGRISSYAIDASDMVIGRGDAGDPLRIGDLALRLTPSNDPASVTATTTGRIRMTDIVTPSASASPLGTAIDVVAAAFELHPDAGDVPGGTGAVVVSDIELDWGVLAATGDGTLHLDDANRMAGALSLAVSRPLTVLDAIHAARGLDRAVMPDVYAAILSEMADRPEATLDFTLDLTGGEIVLRGSPRGTGDLVLGTLAPIP